MRLCLFKLLNTKQKKIQRNNVISCRLNKCTFIMTSLIILFPCFSLTFFCLSPTMYRLWGHKIFYLPTVVVFLQLCVMHREKKKHIQTTLQFRDWNITKNLSLITTILYEIFCHKCFPATTNLPYQTPFSQSSQNILSGYSQLRIFIYLNKKSEANYNSKKKNYTLW